MTLKEEDTINKCVRENQDSLLLGKIEGLDMRAREAMYHESCRRDCHDCWMRLFTFGRLHLFDLR